MIPQLRRYLLENWSQLSMGGPPPRDLDFLVQATGISKLCCYIFVGDEPLPRWVAKMPRTPRDNSILAHEYDVIGHLREAGTHYVRETILGPILTTTLNGHLVGIEPHIPGRPMDGLMSEADSLTAPAIVENLDAAAHWLLRCQRDTLAQSGRLTSKQVHAHLLDPIAQIKATCRLNSLEMAYLDWLSGQIEALASRPLPLVFKHGDFQPGNLLVDGRALRVLDWEFGAVAAPPLLDLFGFLMRTYARYRGQEEMDGYLEDYMSDFEDVFFEGGQFSSTSLAYVSSACEVLHIDPAWVEVLFGLFVVTEANKYFTLLSKRAERGYLYLLKSRSRQTDGSYTYQLGRQKQVWLLGCLAQHADQLVFGKLNWEHSFGQLMLVVQRAGVIL